MTTQEFSKPGRLAQDGEGISLEELALAARNHGMPLEALRYDVTPAGLHYLLIHYDIPDLNPETFQLTVNGTSTVTFTLDELRAMPSATVRVTMECAGNGRARLLPRPVSQPWLVEAVGTAEWTGVPLHEVLTRAGIDPAAVEVVFTGADHGIERGVEQDYQRSLPVAEAMRAETLLAYQMNGLPLLPQHGSPLRLVVPGWYGMAHVKWLTRIDFVAEPFQGFQQATAYRIRQEPGEQGEAITRIAPRALMVPPGFPDFMTRTRVVRPGPVELTGRAWSGRAPLEGVEVSTGQDWHAAVLDADAGHQWAWRRWRYMWNAEPGEYTLKVRAVTQDGETQTDDTWNRGGFTNNAPQEVRVVCVA